jgi:hypothetical protein
MEQFDSRLEEMSRAELGAGQRLLEFCPVQPEVSLLPKPLAPLIPVSIIGLSILSGVTRIGAFAFLAGGIIIALLVYFFLHYKTFVLAAGEKELVLIGVSANLNGHQGTQRLAYGDVVSISEPGKPPSLTVRLGAQQRKLNLLTRHAKLKSVSQRAENLLRAVREKIATSQRAGAAANG